MATKLIIFSLAVIHTSHGLTDLPFSWDRVPTFAFPGAQDGFLTQTQITDNNLTQFNHFLIWGFNVSCQATNGTIYPADATSRGSYYSCGADNLFYPNLESSLSFQAEQLKQKLSPNITVLPYIIFTSAQQSYVAQNIFNQALNSKWWLTLQNVGTINCFNASYHCEFQGPSQHQYDLRQTAVQNYFVNNILMSITNSSAVNGLFLDEVDDWIVNWCNQWKCTQQELQDLSTAVIDTLDNLFSSHKAKFGSNKVFSISMHCNMYEHSDIYFRERAVLEKYNDIAIRFYEDFQDGFNNNFLTYVNETNYGHGGLSQHVHVASKTMNPDWVELAAFLIGANNQSWFSYSNGWNVNSKWYQSEFANKLGKPLNFGNCSSDKQWYIYPNENNIYGAVEPKANSTDGSIVYIGTYNDYNSCLAAIKSSKYGAFSSFTWVNAQGEQYALQCFARFGNYWSPVAQSTTVSGHLDGMICKRNFEFCDVMFDVMNHSATLTWK